MTLTNIHDLRPVLSNITDYVQSNVNVKFDYDFDTTQKCVNLKNNNKIFANIFEENGLYIVRLFDELLRKFTKLEFKNTQMLELFIQAYFDDIA